MSVDDSNGLVMNPVFFLGTLVLAFIVSLFFSMFLSFIFAGFWGWRYRGVDQ